MTQQPAQSAYEKDAYLAKLDAARNRLTVSRGQIIDWVSRLDENAALAFIQIEPMISLFPRKKADSTYRIVYDIHTSPKRYGTLGIALRTESMRVDLSKASSADVAKALTPHCHAADAKSHAVAIQTFNKFNDRVAALRAFGVEFELGATSGPVLPRWFELLHEYGNKCRPALEVAFERFQALTADLDEAMFEFNATMGPVRYRSIRCTYSIDDFDLLGPSNPAIKVITSLNPATRHRRYNRIEDFKKALKKKRIGQKLRRELGRDPDKSEIQEALLALRPRAETEWITKDVIKACYLGRSINDVFEAQEKLVAAMQPWTVMRAQLQALLPQ